jgi:hypothetical protein
MSKHTAVTEGDGATDEFAQAFEQFRGLIDGPRINALQPLGPAAVYTTLVTVWLLVYQRLQGDGTLSDAVHELLRTDPQFLPDNRRVREQTLSANTGSYSQARKRLKPSVTEWVADHVFQTLMSTAPPLIADRRAFVLDGTTISLAPSAALKKAFPPASNQYGVGVWPIAHLLVAHELESGCAILPEIGPKFGPDAMSEAQLTLALLLRLPKNSIVIADRNFGIFSVVFAAVEAGHDVLARLTEQRFRALLRQAEPVTLSDPSPNTRCWRLYWEPTASDRRSNPDLPATAGVEVWLYEIVLSPTLTLWLASSWFCPAEVAVTLYGRRQDIETDIREIKVVLKTEELTSRSEDILRKELAVSIVAYNLVIQLRRLAARKSGVHPRRLSFTGVWSAVRIILMAPNQWSATEWQRQFELTLRIASQHKLPNRPGRSYPRQTHTKRNKSTSGKRPPATK